MQQIFTVKKQHCHDRACLDEHFEEFEEFTLLYSQ